jgi:hypothetical protein
MKHHRYTNQFLFHKFFISDLTAKEPIKNYFKIKSTSKIENGS